MDIKCCDIEEYMEDLAPACLAEGWDNVGLLLGSSSKEVKRVLVCLDVTADVAEEALQKKVDLIISHHPLIFNDIKRINENDPKGDIICKLIRNNIAVFAAHTNMDVTDSGVNDCLAETLELKNIKNLNHYKSEDLLKIAVFVPEESADLVRDAMCGAGAGWIGNYSDCAFMAKGTGTFKPLEGTNPYIGVEGKVERVEEYRLETIAANSKVNAVVTAMLKVHPYEEVAYDIYPLKLLGKEYGLGKVGSLESPLNVEAFIEIVKFKLGTNYIRAIGKKPDAIQKVAVFCGSFDGNLSNIKKQKADVLVTGDIKYHIAQEIVDLGMFVIDAGHFATERIIVPQIAQKLKTRFHDLDIIISEVEEDPIKTC